MEVALTDLIPTLTKDNLSFKCPSCLAKNFRDHFVEIAFTKEGKESMLSQTWGFIGDTPENLTVVPAINNNDTSINNRCTFHGWITKGVVKY